MQHPTILITPVIVLNLFFIMSLIFYLVWEFNFLNKPFVVIFKLLFLTLGNSVLSDSLGHFFNSLYHVKYVIKDIIIIIITINDTKYIC